MSGRSIGLGVLAVAGLLASLQPAGAATTPLTLAADDVAYSAIAKHDWATAEQQLLASLQRQPNNTFAQLNLAWVYAQTGRKAEAAALYRGILDRDKDRVATLSSNESKSMTLMAKRGLARLNQ